MKLKQPVKWHGGKHYLASKIVALMPPHVHYVEPYAGGLSVLLAKNPEGVSEVVNDLNLQLSNFWKVLQGGALFAEFLRVMEAVPFSEVEYRGRMPDDDLVSVDPVGCAAAFFVRCRQSLAGRMKPFTGITKTRTRRGMNNEVSAWLSAVDGLPEVHARLRRVLILNRDALDVIRGQDGPDTLFYLDPPYLHETRATTADYAHEMTTEQHRQLLEVITAPSIRGKVMLSGYRSELYDGWLGDWHRHEFDLPNHASGRTTSGSKRRMTECLWTNFDAAPVSGAA